MVSIQALAQESNTQNTRPQKERKVSFQIRENPGNARHEQKAIWQLLAEQARSFFLSPAAMETAAVCPPSQGRWARRACRPPPGQAVAKQWSRMKTSGHTCQVLPRPPSSGRPQKALPALSAEAPWAAHLPSHHYSDQIRDLNLFFFF